MPAKRGVAALCLGLAILLQAEEPEFRISSAADCTFRSDPDEYLARSFRVRENLTHRVTKFVPPGVRRAAAPAAPLPRRNFIDDRIFGRLEAEGVVSAALTGDAEFLRRIYLDLTGRIPTPEQVQAFLAHPDREAVIDRLLASPEFTDRWTMWFSDLLQVTASSSNVTRQISGRNAFYAALKESVAANKPVRDIAWEAIAFDGSSFDARRGMANFAAGAITPMGPAQDTYDAMLVRSATAWLGMAHYDCLLCHSGPRHLDAISLWGGTATRIQAWRMASHFSRLRLTRSRAAQGEPDYGRYEVTDALRGSYDLNTTVGNRPRRQPPATGETTITPEYHFNGARPADNRWRIAFAENVVRDRMFSRNIANRIWKHFFGLGLVDPVDTLDPARLDPGHPPPQPWTLQASHPELLEQLADEFQGSYFNLRAFIRTVVQSSAYQLSSRYDGPWTIAQASLFARHYPRRLEGEELHDAIVRATGVVPQYKVEGWADPVSWAVQLPEPAEPRSDRAAANFMNAFLRGNRDTQARSQAGAILQQLALMNDTFVLNRIRLSASPVLKDLAQLGDDRAIDRLFLQFLSRMPEREERETAAAHLRGASNRNAALEDLAWAAINKMEFLFSY